MEKKWIKGIAEDGGGKPSNKRLISIWGFILLTIAFGVELWEHKIIRIEFLYIVGGITGATILGITMEGIFALLKITQMGGGGWWGGMGHITNIFRKKPKEPEMPRGIYDENEMEES